MSDTPVPKTSHLVKVLALAAATPFALAAALVLLAPRLPVPMLGGWYLEGAPFEGLRWVDDAAEVQVDGTWFALESVGSIPTGDLIELCKRTDGKRWRKRFSEDLVQALSRLEPLKYWSHADLGVRDLLTDEPELIENVPLSPEWRQRIWEDRAGWPWEGSSRVDGNLVVEYQGRSWELVSMNAVAVADLPATGSLFDAYCEQVGRSPGAFLDLVMRDVATGELETFEDVARVPAALHGGSR